MESFKDAHDEGRPLDVKAFSDDLKTPSGPLNFGAKKLSFGASTNSTATPSLLPQDAPLAATTPQKPTTSPPPTAVDVDMTEAVPDSVRTEVRRLDREISHIKGDIAQPNSKFDHLDGKLGQLTAARPAQLMPRPPESATVDVQPHQHVWVVAK